MAFWNLSPEELSVILAFVNDENDDILKTDLPQRFNNLTAAFQAKIIKALTAERSRVNRAEKSIERLNVRLQGRVAEGTFVELDFSAVDLAKCILYIMKVNNYYCTRDRIQCLLYEAYSRWLADKSERLTSEHPVAQDWGPHFWTVSHRLGNLSIAVSVDDWKVIAEKNPGVARFLENVVKKYAPCSDLELKSMLKQGAPYKNAVPKHVGEKWGKEIKDADIFAWKK